MHLLGTIISVHFIEKERQHALKYSRAVPNSKALLQHLEMTGIYLMNFEQNWKKLCVISTLWEKRCKCSSFCGMLQQISKWKQNCWYFNSSALLYKARGWIYVACIRKICSEANFELPGIADHWWHQNANICWIEELFPKDVEEIFINDEYSENEVNDEEGGSGSEGDTF